MIPGGNSIGVSLYTNGALIVGTSDVTDQDGITHFPAIDAGLLPGDIIEKVNGVSVKDAEAFIPTGQQSEGTIRGFGM